MELYRYRDLVWLWSVRNLTLRYKRSALGILWTLIEPLMLMVVLTIVFSTLFRFALENYAVYILSGLIAFDFFTRSTSQIVEEIIASKNLAQRIYMPRSAFALAAIVSHLVNWLLSLVPLFGIMLVLGHPISWWLLTVPFSMLLLALFSIGVGLIVATLSAFFLDFKLTYAVLVRVLFYATPIIYPASILPDHLVPLFRLNPLLHLTDLFKAAVYFGEGAPLAQWIACLAFGLGTAALGWWVFTRWRVAFQYRV